MFLRKDVYLSQEIALIEKFPLLGSTELSPQTAQDPHSYKAYQAYITIIQSCQDWQSLGNWPEAMPQQKLELEPSTVTRLMCECLILSGRLCESAQLLDCALILSTSLVFQTLSLLCGHQGLKLTTTQVEWAFHFVHCCFNVCFVEGLMNLRLASNLLCSWDWLCFALFLRQLL